MFHKFNERAIKVILCAQEESRGLGHNFVGTEMLLLGLIREDSGKAAQALKSTGVTLEVARLEVEGMIGRGSGAFVVEIPFTPRAKRALEQSWEQAKALGDDFIGTEHLLRGLLCVDGSVSAKVLQIMQVKPEALTIVLEQCSIKEGPGRIAIGQGVKLPPAEKIEIHYAEKTSSPAFAETPAELRKKLGSAKDALDLVLVFEKCSENTLRGLAWAQEESRSTGHKFIGTEQILVGLFVADDGKAARVLKSYDANLGRMRAEIRRIIGLGKEKKSKLFEIPYTPRTERSLNLAGIQAKELGHAYVGTAHILLGVIKEGEGVGPRVLENMGINLQDLRESLVTILASDPKD